MKLNTRFWQLYKTGMNTFCIKSPV